jgi:hypothetical protein
MYSTRSGLIFGFHGCDESVVHALKRQTNQYSFDSVRGVFFEGEEVYPNASFREKDHIQICVRNPNCIKGFFLPRELDKHFQKV